MSRERIRYLFSRHYEKTASVSEKAELMELIRSGQYDDQLRISILEVVEKEKGELKIPDITAEQILSTILQKEEESRPTLSGSLDGLAENLLPSESNRKFARSWIFKLAAASVVLLLSWMGFNFWKQNAMRVEGRVSSTTSTADLAPGTDKAYLSLPNGTQLDLESPETQFILQQHGISNDMGQGELTYRSAASGTGSNTLTTPLGGQYKLVLPDGSRAWLNAGSSLTFPNRFDAGKRLVEMSGEVYFEIAYDPGKPFLVTVKGDKNQKDTEVRVLGTHFNISSYSDEPQIRTTLLEGSVEINRDGVRKRLEPGQQAGILQAPGKSEISIRKVDTNAAVAWKDGLFEFNGNITDIMRQIARWYDVEVRYEGDVIDKSFAGVIPRKKNISEVLERLELTEGIEFVIDNRTVVVKATSM